MAATLARRVEKGADAGHIADAVVAAVQEIDLALAPVIGQRGVAALYERSIFLSCASHPWLTTMYEERQMAMNLEALRVALAQRSSADAADTGGTILRTFYDVLTGVIGPSLAERLLRSVLGNSSSGESARDTSR